MIDASVMSKKALSRFLSEQLDAAVSEDVLFSLHMKATMMKVSDPIIFGHCVNAYLGELLTTHGEALSAAGFNPNNGLSSFYSALENLDTDKRTPRWKLHSVRLWQSDHRLPWSIPTKNHQFTCPQRCDHRCVHACNDPYIRTDVGS